jgi:hypothetical protein
MHAATYILGLINHIILPRKTSRVGLCGDWFSTASCWILRILYSWELTSCLVKSYTIWFTMWFVLVISCNMSYNWDLMKSCEIFTLILYILFNAWRVLGLHGCVWTLYEHKSWKNTKIKKIRHKSCMQVCICMHSHAKFEIKIQNYVSCVQKR